MSEEKRNKNQNQNQNFESIQKSSTRRSERIVKEEDDEKVMHIEIWSEDYEPRYEESLIRNLAATGVPLDRVGDMLAEKGQLH